MRILGAVLAGGQARRFGSDKALALLGGVALIDRVLAALDAQCDAVVVTGRDHPGRVSLADVPRADLGPLGGLAAALAHARTHGFEAVLSAGCDAAGLPDGLLSSLAPAPAVVADLPIVGLWPATLAEPLSAWLAADRPRAVHAFAAAVGARPVALEALPANINTPEDLARLERDHG